ncbi:hypothetical protein R9X47_18445 [Wukongibacter baidiensis]
MPGGYCGSCEQPYPFRLNNLILFLLLIILVGDCLCGGYNY